VDIRFAVPVTEQSYINDFADRSFRDLADQDYIAARVSYRLEMDLLFLWNSLQAIEKYLKAILLYNGKSTKGIGHDLHKALTRVRSIPDIAFQFPADVLEFISYVDQQGTNRYFCHPMYLTDRALLKLDKTIWHVRRYCQYLRADYPTLEGGWVCGLTKELERIHNPHYASNPYRFRVSRGFLEDAIAKNKPSSQYLIWNNLYYARRKRKHITFRDRMGSANPTHFINVGIFPRLANLVDFPRGVREAFNRDAG